MKRCHFTESAENDLHRIADYSYTRWGLARTLRYVEGLRDTAAMLAEHPELGRSVARKPPLRRFEDLHHVLFYREVDDGIEVVCVLHERQDPDSYL
ncbi:MAG: hypothetical protein RLZZ450_957 [Pseudomonadota bacterium]